MTKKGSRFAIEVDEAELESDAPLPSPALPNKRRGPMAAAIAENADSLKERRSREEEIRQENDELAHLHVRMKNLGLVLELVAVDQIDSDKLTRDRSMALDLELDDLIASIREIGLSNPIRAELQDNGRYELIQGHRRLEAYRQLWRETGEENFAKIPVATVPAGDDIETSYRKMVDENLVRKDISFAEMAELARSYSKDPKTPEISVDKAVTALFKAAAYQKRSYIRAFAELLDIIGDHLRFSSLIPRSLGLDLRRALDDESKVATLIAKLNEAPGRSADEELELLRLFAGAPRRRVTPAEPPSRARKETPPRSQIAFAFHASEQSGECTAAKGRLELRLDRDFSAIKPSKFEKAISAFFNVLDQKPSPRGRFCFSAPQGQDR